MPWERVGDALPACLPACLAGWLNHAQLTDWLVALMPCRWLFGWLRNTFIHRFLDYGEETWRDIVLNHVNDGTKFQAYDEKVSYCLSSVGLIHLGWALLIDFGCLAYDCTCSFAADSKN